jgi:hypothetical protein
MRPLFRSPIARVGIRPEAPDAIVAERPRFSRRPHTDARVAAVRRLVEQTALTYGEISDRTGVGRASICRWTRDGGWRRPVFAPRATDTVPRARAGQRLKLRLLAERLRALAERHIRALEETPGADTEKLMQALAVLQAARMEAIGRRGRRRIVLTTHAISDATRAEVTRSALNEMRLAGVETGHLPPDALALAVDARLPAEDCPALRPRGGRRSRRKTYDAWLRERE